MTCKQTHLTAIFLRLFFRIVWVCPRLTRPFSWIYYCTQTCIDFNQGHFLVFPKGLHFMPHCSVSVRLLYMALMDMPSDYFP